MLYLSRQNRLDKSRHWQEYVQDDVSYSAVYSHVNLSVTKPTVGAIIFRASCSRSGFSRFSSVLLPALFSPTSSIRAFRRRGVRPPAVATILVSFRQMFIGVALGPSRRTRRRSSGDRMSSPPLPLKSGPIDEAAPPSPWSPLRTNSERRSEPSRR